MRISASIKQKLIPTFTKIKIPITSPAAVHTQYKITKMRLRDEIKFLYIKKYTINKELHSIHLRLGKEWDKYWDVLQNSISESINKTIEQMYKKLNRKLECLANSKTKNTTTDYVKFYPRVVNKTDIQFSNEELVLLHKGLKYNLNYKRKTRITTLTLEAETVIYQTPIPEQDRMRQQVAINLRKLYT